MCVVCVWCGACVCVLCAQARGVPVPVDSRLLNFSTRLCSSFARSARSVLGSIEVQVQTTAAREGEDVLHSHRSTQSRCRPTKGRCAAKLQTQLRNSPEWPAFACNKLLEHAANNKNAHTHTHTQPGAACLPARPPALPACHCLPARLPACAPCALGKHVLSIDMLAKECVSGLCAGCLYAVCCMLCVVRRMLCAALSVCCVCRVFFKSGLLQGSSDRFN